MYMRVSMCLCVYLTLCVCVCVCVCVMRCISLCAPVEADVSWGWVQGMQGVGRSKNRTTKRLTVQRLISEGDIRARHSRAKMLASKAKHVLIFLL